MTVCAKPPILSFVSKMTRPKKREAIQLHVNLPSDLHRRAKAKAALAQITWDEAITQAVEAWTRSRVAGMP